MDWENSSWCINITEELCISENNYSCIYQLGWLLHITLSEKKKVLQRTHVRRLHLNMETTPFKHGDFFLKIEKEISVTVIRNTSNVTCERRRGWWLRRDIQKASQILEWQFLNVGGSFTRSCLITILIIECIYISGFFCMCSSYFLSYKNEGGRLTKMAE